MKKRNLLLVTLGILGIMSTPSHALLGTNDNVVGYDILVPFFLVSMADHGSLNTLVAITETGRSEATVHCFLYNPGGLHVIDLAMSLTAGDVTRFSIKDFFIENLSTRDKESMEIDLDGDGTNDHYAGYMAIDNQNTEPAQNHLIATAYVIDTVNGISAGMNLPVREVDESGHITDGKLINTSRGTEYFSANALFRARQYIELQGKAGNVIDAEYLRLTPHYNIPDTSSHNYFFIWTNKRCSSTTVLVYDDDENYYSRSISALHQGFNYFNVRRLVSAKWEYPKSGWVDIKYKNSFDGDREMLGYSFLMKPVSPGICGDVTGEGLVDMNDAIHLAQFLEGNRECICSDTPKAKCDPNTLSAINPPWISLTEMNRDAGTVES